MNFRDKKRGQITGMSYIIPIVIAIAVMSVAFIILFPNISEGNDSISKARNEAKDCDGDGIANGFDEFPCDETNTQLDSDRSCIDQETGECLNE